VSKKTANLLEMKKVLIVDDEEDIVIYLATLLENNGYRVFQARSIEEAEKRIAQETPDLICLDIMMPKQTGIAFYRELKLDERTQHIPAVFISALSNAPDFLDREFRTLIHNKNIPKPAAYLEKPVDVEKLIQLIQDLTGGESDAGK